MEPRLPQDPVQLRALLLKVLGGSHSRTAALQAELAGLGGTAPDAEKSPEPSAAELEREESPAALQQLIRQALSQWYRHRSVLEAAIAAHGGRGRPPPAHASNAVSLRADARSSRSRSPPACQPRRATEEKHVHVHPRLDDLQSFQAWFTKHEPPRGKGQRIQLDEGWLKPLTYPATPSQRQSGRDKCFALAKRDGLPMFTSHESEQAASHLRAHGFVVMCDVLSDSVLATVQQYYAEAIRIAVRCNPMGNRGHHRYSLGKPPWMLGLPVVAQPEVIDVLRHYFKTNDVVLESLTGDFSLPGAAKQRMHIDMRCGKHDHDKDMANVIKVYYTMMDHDDITGPTRFVKGSQRRSASGEKAKEEESILAFAPKGSAMIMDLRVWHGGTVNNSQYARPIIGAHYQGPHSKNRPIERSLDRERFEQLTKLEQQVCRRVLKLESEPHHASGCATGAQSESCPP